VAFFTTPSPNGFGLLSLTGASGFDAFLVAFVLQLIASSIQKNKENKENNGKTQRRILG
jgi:cytosine permease